MNLIQIQEHLKDLPTQAIMSYANGQNPQVPPYMALSELNRRKSMEQRAAQQPTASVKDQLEAEVGQHLPQGLPQMPQAPQGIAQLPAAQGAQQAPEQPMPQMPQGPQEPQGMAGGGLAGLEVDDEMFHYAPGGIVAFANEENKQVVPEEEVDYSYVPPDTPGVTDRSGTGARLAVPAPKQEAASGLQALMPQASNIIARAMAGDVDLPEIKNPEDIRKEVMDKYPELAGLVNTIPGADLKKLSDQLQAQNAESKAKFQESQGRMGLAGLSQALIAAGQATRGHKGMGLGEALGGFGTSYNNFTAEDIKRQQAQQALERQQSIEVAKLNADIATLQQAYARAQIEGRVSDAAAYQKAISDRASQIQSIQLGAAEKTGTMVNAERTLEATIEHNKAIQRQQEAALEETRLQHEAQRKQWEAESRNRAEQLEIMRETKPTVEDRKLGKILQVMPARVKSLEARQKDLEFGSDEWNEIQSRIDDMYDQAYDAYGLTPPPRLAPPKAPPVKEKSGIFSGLFSKGNKVDSDTYAANPYGNDQGAVAASNTQYASNPTTGERIMSNDGGKTWIPLGGKR